MQTHWLAYVCWTKARPFDPGDTTEQHIKTRACFERLADGTADNDDLCALTRKEKK